MSDFERLCDRWADGEVTPEEEASLVHSIKNNQEQAKRFARRLFLHSTLRQEMQTRVVNRRSFASRERRLWAWGGGSLLAASLLAGVVFGWLMESPAPAIVHETMEAVAENQSLLPGQSLKSGVLNLRSGVLSLLFRDGTSLVVEGPAKVEIVSSQQVVIYEGKATAKVGTGPFRLDTPKHEFIDSQVAFGVNVDQQTGVTGACIFEGNVEVQTNHDAKRSLSAGTAFEDRTGRLELIKFDVEGYETLWSLENKIRDVEGAVRVMPPGPRDLTKSLTRDFMMLVPEAQGVLLAGDLLVEIAEPGDYSHFRSLPRRPVGRNSRVRSYLLHFEPHKASDGWGQSRRLTGSVTFCQPVVGIMATDASLAASDSLLGLLGNDYFQKNRGLEGLALPDGTVLSEGDDFVRLSADRRTVEVGFRVHLQRDEIRILVHDPDPIDH